MAWMLMLYSNVYGNYVLFATVSKTTRMKVIVDVSILVKKNHLAFLFSSLINVILNVVPHRV